MTRYPEDEFDRAAQSRGPKGVHRPAEPAWKKFLPLILALVLGPLLAWGFVSALNRDNTADPVADPTPTATETAGAGETPDPGTEDPTTGEGTEPTEPTEEPAEPTEPTEPTEPVVEEPQVNYEAAVTVYNGARIAGIAGRTSERLEAAGFTDVTPADYGEAQPVASTVYYNNAELADTAEAIGEELGITEVVELAEATDSISVILRTDFQE